MRRHVLTSARRPYVILVCAQTDTCASIRGSRSCSDVPALQVRAVIHAAVNASRKGIDARPDIMIPLISTLQELRHQAALIHATARAVLEAEGVTVKYRVGTMIETPRAALLAGEIAEFADFFSFGTNDLTQMTYGMSRDDVGRFLPVYLHEKILPADPFQVRAARSFLPCDLTHTAHLRYHHYLYHHCLPALLRPWRP